MKKLAKKIFKEEKKLDLLEIDKKKTYGRLWLNTDFQTELNLNKKPTEQDKKSCIQTNTEYIDICTQIANKKALVHYLNTILEAKKIKMEMQNE